MFKFLRKYLASIPALDVPYKDTVMNSTPNVDISKKHENIFFLIKLKIFYIWALIFLICIKLVLQGLK